MEKLLITNQVEKYKLDIDCPKYHELNFMLPDIFIMLEDKEIVNKLENVKQFGDDFCILIVTAMYKKSFNNLLSRLYNCFSGDIVSIKEELIGIYLCVLKKNSNIYIFTDKYGIYDLYYKNIEKKFCITTDILSFKCNKIDVDEFYHHLFLISSAYSGKTFYKDVSRLKGYEYILIDPVNIHFSVEEIAYQRKKIDFSNATIDEAVEQYTEKILDYTKPIADFFGNDIAIQQTGGLDNRTIFAALMNLGCTPRTLYGKSDPYIVCSHDGDLEACIKYKERFNLDFHCMKWDCNYVDNIAKWAEMLENYGVSFTIYGGNKGFFQNFSGGIQPYPSFIECGYFLENLRLREDAYGIDNKKYTLKDFVTSYLLDGYGGISFARNHNNPIYQNLVSLIENAYKKEMEKFSLDPNCFSEQNFDEIRWVHSRYVSSETARFLNKFTYSLPIFSIPELHEFPFDVPSEWRKDAQFQLRVIDKLYSDVFDVPIFTHRRKYKLNKQNFTLKYDNSLFLSMNDFVRRHFSSEFHNKIKNIYWSIFKDTKVIDKESSLREALLLLVIELRKDLSIDITFPLAEDMPLASLLSYAQYLFMFKENCA